MSGRLSPRAGIVATSAALFVSALLTGPTTPGAANRAIAQDEPAPAPIVDELRRERAEALANAYGEPPSRLLQSLSRNREWQEIAGLDAEQVGQVQQMDALLRSLWKSSVAREVEALGKLPPGSPAPPSVLTSLEEGAARRRVAADSADRLVHSGVLTPAQSGIVEKLYWSSLGVEALRDPRFARRLKIPRSQHDLIVARLDRMDVENLTRRQEADTAVSKLDPDAEQVQRTLREQSERDREDVLTLLNANQRKLWDECRDFRPIRKGQPKGSTKK